MSIKHKKGDRVMVHVEYKTKDDFIIHAKPNKKTKTLYGTVKRGGSKNITFVIDGGDSHFSAPAGYFKTSDKPAKKDPPNKMDAYKVRKYKSIGGDETDCFTAEIVTPQKHVITVKNRGTGGPNRYDSQVASVVQKLYEDVDSWAKQFNSPYENVTDLWVSFAIHKKPYNVTATDYFAVMRHEKERWAMIH